MSRLKDVPELRRDGGNINEVMQAVRETLQTYRGYRGDPLDAALTLRDAIDRGILMRNLFSPAGSSNPSVYTGPGGSGWPIDGPYITDLTPPPTPEGLDVTAAISNLLVRCDVATYTAGHGHALTVVYGAKWPTATVTPPTFADAVELFRFPGTVAGYTTDPATRWCIWIKWLSKDGVLSASPAGGTNGFQVTTATSVADLLGVFSDKITGSQLSSTLNSSIDLISGAEGLAGSVNARIKELNDTLQPQISALALTPDWDTLLAYAIGDTVKYGGSLYQCTVATTDAMDSPDIDTSHWNKVGNYDSLATAVGAHEASINAINFVNAGSTSSAAVALSEVKAAVEDATTGLATRASATDLTYALTDPSGALAVKADELKAYSDARVVSFVSASAPTATAAGDLWIDSDDENKLYRWSGSAWEPYRDSNASALVSTLESTKIGYSRVIATGSPFDAGGTITNKTQMDAWNTANGATLEWKVGLPLAQAIKQLTISAIDPTTGLATTGTIEDRMTAVATTASSMYLEKAVRIGSGGSVVGYGLSGHVSAGEPVVTDSKFIANVDTFAVKIPEGSIPLRGNSTAYAANAIARVSSSSSKMLVCRTAGTSAATQYTTDANVASLGIGSLFTDGTVQWRIATRVLFSTSAGGSTIDGITVPTGSFMDGAFIRNLNAGSITAGTIDADVVNVVNVTAVDIEAGSVMTGTLESTGTTVVDSVAVKSWKINADGTATFNNAVVRGGVYAAYGLIGGNTIDATSIHSGTTGYGTGTGFYLGSNGTFSLGDKFTWNGTTLSINGGGTFSGALSAATGNFGAVTVATNGSLSSGQTAYDTGTGFWLGDVAGTKKFSLGNAAGHKITWNGSTLSIKGTLNGADGTFSGTLTADAINAVSTINIAGNSVTLSNASSGTSPSTNITVPDGQTARILAIAHVPNASSGGSAVDRTTLTMTFNGVSYAASAGPIYDNSGTFYTGAVTIVKMVDVTGPATVVASLVQTSTSPGTVSSAQVIALFGSMR